MISQVSISSDFSSKISYLLSLVIFKDVSIVCILSKNGLKNYLKLIFNVNKWLNAVYTMYRIMYKIFNNNCTNSRWVF